MITLEIKKKRRRVNEGGTSEKRDEQLKRRDNPYKRMLKKHAHVLARIICGIIAVFMVLGVVFPDRSFSANENRNLAGFPAISVKSITEGAFFTDLADYMSDQFVGRDVWLTINLFGQRILGRVEVNDVLIGHKGYLMEYPTEIDQTAVDRKTAAMKTFAQGHSSLNVSAMIVPCAAATMEKRRPLGVSISDQIHEINSIYCVISGSGINTIDVASELASHAGKYIYYKTDHHWTGLGAYYAYLASCHALQISNPINKYTIYTVSDDFKGTLASKTGEPFTKDKVQIYVPEKDETVYYVNYPDTEEQSPTLYVRDKLDEKDDYQVFFGGNHALVEIHTANDTGRNLLIFKDSYANSFVSFLLPYFDDIYMVDPRYYYDDLNGLISASSITDVLFLYSENTFANDTTLADVLESAVNPTAKSSSSKTETSTKDDEEEDEDEEDEDDEDETETDDEDDMDSDDDSDYVY